MGAWSLIVVALLVLCGRSRANRSPGAGRRDCIRSKTWPVLRLDMSDVQAGNPRLLEDQLVSALKDEAIRLKQPLAADETTAAKTQREQSRRDAEVGIARRAIRPLQVATLYPVEGGEPGVFARPHNR